MNILVIGDSCIDEYIYCSTDRFCPDAPVPILKPESYVSTEGMAGNVADNLISLGAEVNLITNANRIKKTRFVDERTNHMFVRIDEGENDIFPIEKRTLENIKNSASSEDDDDPDTPTSGSAYGQVSEGKHWQR